MANQLFRKSAIEKMSSLDQLDKTIIILNPCSWLVLVAAAVVIFAAMFWGVFGSVSDKVSGQGIIVSNEEMTRINYSNQGMVKDILIRNEDYVKQGQIIAIIERNDLLEEINLTQKRIENLQILYKLTANLNKNSGASAQKQKQMRELLELGLITENEFKSYNQNDYSTKQQLIQVENQINETKQTLEAQKKNYDKLTKIPSTIDGYVYEVAVAKGDFIGAGTTIAIVGPSNMGKSAYYAKLYLSAIDGKKIKKGMDIAIIPSTIKQEEYGFIHGVITDVSSYPVSPEYILASLQNRTLAQNFSRIQNPIEVKVELVKNEKNFSGLDWSSSKGPNAYVNAGIICTGQASVNEKKPIELVIPKIRQIVFGIGNNNEAGMN